MRRLDLHCRVETHDQLKALAQATGHWQDPRVQQMIGLAVQRQNEARIKYLVKRFERQLAVDDSGFHPFLPGPEPEDLSDGDIKLGTLNGTDPVLVHHNDLRFNMLFGGPPGKGKSVLVTQVVEQLLRLGIPERFTEESAYISRLGVGEAIVSLKGRVNVPLHVAFPKVDVRKGSFRDADVARHSSRRQGIRQTSGL